MLAPQLTLTDRLSDQARRAATSRPGQLVARAVTSPPADPPPPQPRVQHSLYDVGQSIVRMVSAAYGLPPSAITGPGRDPLQVECRTVIMALLAERGLGASSIGRIVGRDHSTVLHHLDKMEQGGATPELLDMLADCRAQVARVPWIEQFALPAGTRPGRPWNPRAWRPASR